MQGSAWVRVADRDLAVVVQSDGTLIHQGASVDAAGIIWLPPVSGEIIGVALNLESQLQRLDGEFHRQPHVEPPRTPVCFMKPHNTRGGHDWPVPLPPGSDSICPGAALAVIIGTTASGVGRADAMAHVGGYCLYNDFSLPGQEFFRPPVRSKCFDGAGPLGPWVTAPERVPDPAALILRTTVNDVPRQAVALADLHWSVAELIESLSAFMTLHAHDVIFTGLPDERIEVRPGDTVTVSAEGLGALRNHVVSLGEYEAFCDARETAA